MLRLVGALAPFGQAPFGWRRANRHQRRALFTGTLFIGTVFIGTVFIGTVFIGTVFIG